MILGLTGSIGGGKSTVREFLVSRQWVGFDADEYCKEIWQNPTADFLRQVERDFGPALFGENGTLDREKIADAIFSDPLKMEKWLAILYPALESKMQSIIRSCRSKGVHAVLEVPLLFENSYEKLFDKVMTVWCPAAIRAERLSSQRKLDVNDIRRREALQLDDDKKLEKADIGIINSRDRDFLIMQLEKFLISIK